MRGTGGPVPFWYMGLVILAWMIFWHYLLRFVTAHHANSPAAQGASVLI